MRWRLGEGLAAGTFLLFIALVPYRSTEPQLFGRWSYQFAILLGIVLLALLLAVRELRTPPAGPIDGAARQQGPRVLAKSLDLGVALWGAGYLVGTIFAPGSRGRLLELDLLGSSVPAASLLEWGGAAVAAAGLGRVLWSRLARRSRWLAAGVTLPLGLLVVGEGVARGAVAYRPHPTPHASATDSRWSTRFVNLDDDGFRDRGHAVVAPPRTSRLLVAGGSDAFGVGIENPRDRFSEQVAIRLEPISDRLWESINVGERGSRTPDHVEALRRGLRYDPDVVLLLYSFDDIRYLAPTIGLDPPRILYLNSMLFQEAWSRFAPALLRGPADTEFDPYADPALLEAHFDDLRGWVATAADSGRIVAIVPVDIETASESGRRYRYRTFLRQADSAGLPVWGVEEAFRGVWTDTLAVHDQYRRPNALAQGLVAEVVARRVRASIPVPAVPNLTPMP